jgi:hypothetical protein
MVDLKIFTENIEHEALNQIYTLVKQPAFSDCKIRIMPDVHAGAGCVIGFTADLGEKVIPNIVGVDIGCGMLTTNLGNIDIDFEKLDNVIREYVPSGRRVHEEENSSVASDIIEKLYCKEQLKNIDWLKRSCGTLGGGNHFIEVDSDSKNNKYLVIHSGSRNVGKQVAEIYQQMAIDDISGKSNFKQDSEKLIAEYKKCKREREISKAIKELKQSYESGGNVTINEQQYIADYVDVENGKIVKCVEKLFLKQAHWGIAINKGVLRFYGRTNEALGIDGSKIIKNAFSISSHFAFVTNTPDRIGTFIANTDGIRANIGFAFSTDTTITSDDFNNWILNNKPFVLLPVLKEELPLTSEQIQALKELATYYPVTNISVNSEQLDGYTVFNYPISMANGWNYVKQQLNDNRDYIYDMDTQSTEAYVNSEYAVALTELEV